MKQVSVKKNAILNVIKQVLNIAFPLLTFPYVSKILMEENYGKYSFGTSIISYVAMVAALGINAYSIREGARVRSKPQQLQTFACEIYTINLVTTLLAYAGLGFALIFWNKLAEYRVLILVQSTSVLFTALGADWVNQIFEDYEYMTKRYIFIKFVSLICIYLFVRKQNDYILYAGIIAGSDILANLLNIFYVRRYVHLKPVLKCHFRQHIPPLVILASNNLAMTIHVNLAMTMLGIYQSDSVVGIYSFASKIYQIAKNLLNAIVMVTIPRLSVYLGADNLEAYNKLLKNTFQAVVILTLPLIGGIFALNREIIVLLGGESYLMGTSALCILTIALIPVAISNIYFNGVLIANRKEKYCAMITILCVCVNVLLNILLIPSFSLTGAALATLISEIISCVMTIWYSRSCCENILKPDKILFFSLLGTVAVWVCCQQIKLLFDSAFLICAISIVVSIFVYGVILALTQWPAIRRLFTKALSKKRKPNN